MHPFLLFIALTALIFIVNFTSATFHHTLNHH
ncbi:hypothetical protein PSMA108079_21385 [Pseudoalteromonas mariniglutinosa]